MTWEIKSSNDVLGFLYTGLQLNTYKQACKIFDGWVGYNTGSGIAQPTGAHCWHALFFTTLHAIGRSLFTSFFPLLSIFTSLFNQHEIAYFYYFTMFHKSTVFLPNIHLFLLLLSPSTLTPLKNLLLQHDLLSALTSRFRF